MRMLLRSKLSKIEVLQLHANSLHCLNKANHLTKKFTLLLTRFSFSSDEAFPPLALLIFAACERSKSDSEG